MRAAEILPTFEAWQAAARLLLHDAVPPAEVTWREMADAPAEVGPAVPR